MDKEIGNLESIFDLSNEDVEDKRTTLGDMVARHVLPGMAIHLADGANALIREVLRRFYGTQPRFTLVATGLGGDALNLVHCGLVNKVVTSVSAEFYPTPGPSPVVQRAYRSKSLEIEHWSFYSLTQRLMAGALGLPFLPTKSIIGSSMATENAGSFQSIADPFDESQQVGLVKALNPDISLVHAWAADRSGNAIMRPPFASGELAWGARAARHGALLTAEYIVPTSFIRDHQHLVNIPAALVRAVSHVPLGAHPDGHTITLGVKEFEGYVEDRDFMVRRRQASRRPETLDEWIQEWTISCPMHDDYLHKLGRERISALRSRIASDDWKLRLDIKHSAPSIDEACNPREAMIVTAAAKIEDKLSRNRYCTMLTGFGAAGLASWLAYFSLKAKGQSVDLLVGSGLYGLVPRPGDPVLASYQTIRTCKMISNVVDAYGVMVAGANNRCLSVLSAGQIDKQGNLNTTIMPGDVYLTGAGGANDAVAARESVVLLAQSRDRLVTQVPYVSTPGHGVTMLITDRGVFERQGGDDFMLTEYIELDEKSEDQCVAGINDTCGWDLIAAPGLRKAAPPAKDQLRLLRLLDPEGHFRK